MVSGLFKTRAYSKRHYVLVMMFAILLAGGLFIVNAPSAKTDVAKYITEEIITSATTTNEYGRAVPTRLVIPKINLDTTFVPPLVLLPDQTVSVPGNYTQVGWYGGGVTPGEIGSSVILGHLDSVAGPAVFYSLGQLKEGDEIEITRDDGTVAKFTVTKLQRVLQSNFPTMDVYGPTDDAQLRLVTCSGVFNKITQRYSHNLIVFASLK